MPRDTSMTSNMVLEKSLLGFHFIPSKIKESTEKENVKLGSHPLTAKTLES